MKNINYEDEIEEKILDGLKQKFSLYDEEVLYRYIRLRCKCIQYKISKEYNNEDSLIQLLIDELYLDKLIYKESKISLLSGFENSLKNIIDNWSFRYSYKAIEDENGNIFNLNMYLDKAWKKVNDYTNKKTKGISSPFLKELIVFYRLEKLNKIFGINEINPAPMIDGFKYGANFFEQISVEEKMGRYVHATNFNTSDLAYITEEDFENYIYKHLDLIEKGLTPIDRQVSIEEGRIDILAKDKNKKFVVIELKIANDKHLIWQVMYYPDAIKDKLKLKDVRMITICPSYPNYILNPLKKLEYVEMFQYKLQISNSKIEKAKFEKI